MSVISDLFLREEWDKAVKRVRKGLERLGHDIPLTAYSYEDNFVLGKRKKNGPEK